MAAEGTPIPITEAQAVIRGKQPQDPSKPLIDQVSAIAPIKVGERRFSGTAAGIVPGSVVAQSEPTSPPYVELNFSSRVTKEKENLRKRDFGGMRTGEISNTINDVVDDVRAQYPDISVLSFYQMVASRITQHVSSRVQQEALQAIEDKDPEQAKAGANTFLFINLHKILVAIEPYITENDQSNEDVVGNAITGVVEGFKNSLDRYSNHINAPSLIIYNDAQRAVKTVIARDVQLPITVFVNKMSKEIFKRAGEYASGQGLSEQALQELSKRAGISEKTLKDYFADYNLLQKEQTANREWEENPTETAAQQQELRQQIHDVLDKLPVRERYVLILRFGLADGIDRTQEEVGRVIGTKKERARQIEVKALRKLRHPSRAAKLRDYHLGRKVKYESSKSNERKVYQNRKYNSKKI